MEIFLSESENEDYSNYGRENERRWLINRRVEGKCNLSIIFPLISIITFVPFFFFHIFIALTANMTTASNMFSIFVICFHSLPFFLIPAIYFLVSISAKLA